MWKNNARRRTEISSGFKEVVEFTQDLATMVNKELKDRAAATM